jgi:hypothetical protein
MSVTVYLLIPVPFVIRRAIEHMYEMEMLISLSMFPNDSTNCNNTTLYSLTTLYIAWFSQLSAHTTIGIGELATPSDLAYINLLPAD